MTASLPAPKTTMDGHALRQSATELAGMHRHAAKIVRELLISDPDRDDTDGSSAVFHDLTADALERLSRENAELRAERDRLLKAGQRDAESIARWRARAEAAERRARQSEGSDHTAARQDGGE